MRIEAFDGRTLLRRWTTPAVVAIGASALELAGESARVAFRYERAAALDGEAWRLITGNLVHLGPRHLALNLGGLVLVMAVAGRALDGWRGAIAMAASMATVGAGLMWFAPTIGWYVGLSGALHGLLAFVALDALSDRAQRAWGTALLAMLAAKLAWEQVSGPIPFTAAAAGGPVVVVAHLFGALGGASAALATRRSVDRTDERPSVDAQV